MRYLLCFVTGLFWFSQYAFVSYMSPTLQSIGSTAAMIGLVAGMAGLAQLILRVPLGIIAGLIRNHKLIIILGCLTTAVSVGLMGLAFAEWQFLILRTFTGIGAATWISFTVLFSSYYDPSEQNKAIGLINVFNNAGRILSFALGSAASMMFGIRSTFFLSSAIGFVAAGLALMLEEKKSDKPPQKLRDLLSVGLERKLLVPSLLSTMLFFVTFGTAYSFTSNYALSVGIPAMHLGFITSVFALFMVLGSAAAGSRLYYTAGPRALSAASFLMLAIYCAGIICTRSLFALYFWQIFGGFGNGLGQSLYMTESVIRFEPEKKSSAMGFYQAMYSLGMTFGPILMGWAVDQAGFSVSFWAMAALSIAGLLASLVILPRGRQGAGLQR